MAISGESTDAGVNRPSRWHPYHGNPVLSPGPPGSWDAGALGTMSVVLVDRVFHLYYEAWGERSDAAWDEEEYFSLQIGHATSVDGIQWTKDPANPVLRRGNPGEFDYRGTWDPFVLFEDGLFKMWYGGGANDYCDWAYATSGDGTVFHKQGQISNLGNVEDIHVVRDVHTGRFHAYYWDRAHEPDALFHVTSPDETSFAFDQAERVTIRGETYPGQYKFPHVVQDGGLWYMFYGDFARPHCASGTVRLATSTDGAHWEQQATDLVAGHDGEALKAGQDHWLMYYGPQGYFDRKDCSINVAEYSGSLANL